MSHMIIETPQPRNAHLFWLSEKAPLATGHKLIITAEDDITPILARSMKLNKTYDVQIFNRKKEFVDAFAVTYTYSKHTDENMLIRLLGSY